MMRSHLTLLTASMLATGLFLTASALRAQEKPPALTQNNLAVEIAGHGPGIPVSTSSDEGFIETNPPARLPNWKEPSGMLPLTRVRIRSTVEGDGVRLRLAAVFDDSQLPDDTGAKYGEKEEPLATYFAREGETIKVAELARFGFQPMRIKVVRTVPRRDEPDIAVPAQITNALQSVTVVSFESDARQPAQYSLSLRNLSAKSIIALSLHSSNGYSHRVESLPHRPLMLPGADWQMALNVGGDRVWTPQGFVQNTEPQTWSIETIIFTDGTYEGQLKTAAEFVATHKGRQIQLARAIRLFQNLLDAPEPDAAATLEKLKSQVSTLRIDVEAQLVDELLARFPQLSSKDDRAWLKSTVMDGLKGGRQEALFRLKDIEEARTRNTPNFSFQQSLLAATEQLARRIGGR